MVEVDEVSKLKAVAKCAAGGDDWIAKAHCAYLNAQVWCRDPGQSGESLT